MESRFIELDKAFTGFRTAVFEHFAKMHNGHSRIYRIELDQAAKENLWKRYISTLTVEGNNPTYRQRGYFDCEACKHFIRQFGGIVTINVPDDETKAPYIETIWNLPSVNSIFDGPAKEMNDFIIWMYDGSEIFNIFLSKNRNLGTDYDWDIEDGKEIKWEHLYLPTPGCAYYTYDIPKHLSETRSTYKVFRNALSGITMEALDTIMALIADNNLYRGREYLAAITRFREIKEKHDRILSHIKETLNKVRATSLFAWKYSIDLPNMVTHIKNTSIGKLLMDVSEGMDLEVAVASYESIVAPENYKRPKAIYTAKQLEEAKKKFAEAGFMDSLARRFANMDDIKTNNILFANRDSIKVEPQKESTSGEALFDSMDKSVRSVDPRKFTNATPIPIDAFCRDVLPTSTDVEILFESRLMKNLMSLIAPVNPNSRSLFNWNNRFSWAYRGNLADSTLKKNVEKAGGQVVGDLRFSIQWNDIPGDYDGNDLDAHCVIYEGLEGNVERTRRLEEQRIQVGNHIHFGYKTDPYSRGGLDIDIINPKRDMPAVENIIFPNRRTMRKGEYLFFTHCYTNRGGRQGFRAEIEFDGQIYSYNYNIPMKQGEIVKVASVILYENGEFKIKEYLKSSSSAREVWDVTTNQFVPVGMIMHSPNFWDGESKIGAEHTFFILKGCHNHENPNGFFNEYLTPELKDFKHVMEALGSKTAVTYTDDQLSGIGFNHTQKNDVIIKVKTTTDSEEKIFRVTF